MLRAAVAFGAVVLCAVAALAAPVPDAAACSCIRPDVARDLPRADAAFVGTLVSQRAEGSAGFSTFEVERVAKGDLPAEVVVRAGRDGAACGLELAKGSRTGLLLQREGGEWVSSLCSQVDAEALLAVAPGAPVARDDNGSRWWIWIVAGGALLGAAAVAAAARSRRSN